MTVVDLAARRLVIGGSDAAAACGLDPYRSRVMLWLEKTGRVERPDTEAMLWGTLLEPVVFGVLAERREVLPAPADGFRDPERPWLVSHPDGFTEARGCRAVLEIKTAGYFTGSAWDDDAAPTGYAIQAQHNMHATGCAVAVLACLVGGQKLHERVVERDQESIDLMLELEAELAAMVREDRPPEPDGSESAGDALRAMYPEGVPGKVARLDVEGTRLWAELHARRRQRDAVQAQVDELEQRIKARMGDATEAVTYTDKLAARWSSHLRTSLDTARLRRDHPALAAEYSSTSSVRRFTVE